MDKLKEYCKQNNLHIIAEEDMDYSLLTVDQEAGAFVVVSYRIGYLISRYTIKGGLKVSRMPSGEVCIETLPVKNKQGGDAHKE